MFSKHCFCFLSYMQFASGTLPLPRRWGSRKKNPALRGFQVSRNGTSPTEATSAPIQAPGTSANSEGRSGGWARGGGTTPSRSRSDLSWKLNPTQVLSSSGTCALSAPTLQAAIRGAKRRNSHLLIHSPPLEMRTTARPMRAVWSSI